MFDEKLVDENSPSLDPRPVKSKRSTATPVRASSAAIRRTAARSFEHVKQCAKSAKARTGPLERSSRAERLAPEWPAKFRRRGCEAICALHSDYCIAHLCEARRLLIAARLRNSMHLIPSLDLKGIDYHQSTEPDLLFRDVSLYTQTIASAAQAPGVIHQAIASAYAGPGVAHLTLPQDVLSSKVEHAVPSVATLNPRGEITPGDDEIDAVARRIDAAGSVAILCGAGCRGSADLLRELSDRLKAPLVHTVRGKEIIAYDDPHWMGGLGMIGSKPAYNAVQDCELLLMVGRSGDARVCSRLGDRRNARPTDCFGCHEASPTGRTIGAAGPCSEELALTWKSPVDE